jgi:hypothetical protein
MHLSSIIIGPVITEKAEAQKLKNVYTIKVHPHATKIDVKMRSANSTMWKWHRSAYFAPAPKRVLWGRERLWKSVTAASA